MDMLEVRHVLADDEQVVLAFVNPFETRDRLVAIGPKYAKGPSRLLARPQHGRRRRQLHAVVPHVEGRGLHQGHPAAGTTSRPPRGCSRDAWDTRRRSVRPRTMPRAPCRWAPVRRRATPRPQTHPTTPLPAGAQRPGGLDLSKGTIRTNPPPPWAGFLASREPCGDAPVRFVLSFP